jgi:hypothetical protein
MVEEGSVRRSGAVHTKVVDEGLWGYGCRPTNGLLSSAMLYSHHGVRAWGGRIDAHRIKRSREEICAAYPYFPESAA